MGMERSGFFKAVCRVVLIGFYFQNLHPGNLGYGPGGFHIPLGFSTAAADTAPPAVANSSVTLTPRNLAADDYLGSTPEANTSDPYVTQKAAELNHDPARIYAYVRDEIRNEIYKGSLRGARGTLWSKAGNSLDKASLLAALLRVSNVKARYAHGILMDELARPLVLSMFRTPLSVVGCLPDDTLVSAPGQSAELLAAAKEHYWVEFDSGGGFQPADPSATHLNLGENLVAAQDVFVDIPDSLRHRVAVRLKRELRTPFASLISGYSDGGADVKTVLNQSFTTAELVGKPLSVGHSVNVSSFGAFFVSVTSNTYSPYLLIGGGDGDIDDDMLIRGEDYQEQTVSGFSAGNTVVTGIFLETEIVDPDGRSKILTRSLGDRIGFAQRRNGGSASSTASPLPLVTDLDIVTANILPGLQDPLAMEAQQLRTGLLKDQLDALRPRVDAIPAAGPQTEAQFALLAQANAVARKQAIVANETNGIAYALASDLALDQLQKGYLTKAYYASPRVVLSLSKHEGDALRFKLDLQKNDVLALPLPGQAENAAFFFEMFRGYLESVLEGKVLTALTGQTALSVGSIFAQVPDDKPVRLISRETSEALETLALSGEAKARISQALDEGRTVLAPTGMVTVDGRETVGWLETDWTNGHTISVLEDGSHGAIGEYIGVLYTAAAGPLNQAMLSWIGTIHGWAIAQYGFIGPFLSAVATKGVAGSSLAEVVKDAKSELENTVIPQVNKILQNATPTSMDELGKKAGKCLKGKLKEAFVGGVTGSGTGGGFLEVAQCLEDAAAELGGTVNPIAPALYDTYRKAVGLGLQLGLNWLKYNFPGDPAVFPFLSSPLAAGPVPVNPGSQAGVSAQIVNDSLFYLPFNGAQLPSIFKAQIRNTGPATDTYGLAFSQAPAGFSARSSLPSVTVPPGQTAEVGVCLDPAAGALSPPGSSVPFALKVSSTSNPSVQDTAQSQVTTPALHAVSLTLDATAVSVTPGGTLTPVLTLTASGNLGERVALRAVLPDGVQLDGLPAEVTLAAGESRQFPLTVRIDPGAAINRSLDIVVQGNIADAPPPSQRAVALRLNLRSSQAVAIDKSVDQAAVGSNSQLAGVLADFRDAYDRLQSAPGDQGLWDRLRLAAENLSKLAAADPLLVPYASESANLATLVQRKDIGALPSLVPAVFADLAQASALGVVAALSPNTGATQPGVAHTTSLTLKNRGKRPASLSLALEGLPAGVAASVGVTAVNLEPGATRTIPVTLTPDSAGHYSYRVVARVAGFDKPVQAYGWLLSATATVNLLSVSGTPPFILKDGSTRIQARIANPSGIAIEALATVILRNADGSVRYQSANPTSLSIGGEENGTAFLLDTVSALGWPEGDYALEVRLTDRAGKAIAGGLGQGRLGIGVPIKAVAAAYPAAVPPGDSRVATSIDVTPQFAAGGGGIVGLEPTDPSLDRIDWAAASRGANVQVVNSGPASVPAAQLLDETRNLDTGYPYYGPGSPFYVGVNRNGGYIQVDLSEPRTIDTLEFRLWDGDNRYAQYKIEASLDNVSFFSVADKTAGEQRGLQRIKLPPTAMRYIRITGTYDSRDANYFYLTDEILAIGDGVATPVPTQTVTLDAIANGAGNYGVGQKLNLNAGIYEIKQTSGAISYWPDDSQNFGKTWIYDLQSTVAVTGKSYAGTGKAIAAATQAEAAAASAGRTYRLYVPVHSDVYFWIYDTVSSDNRGSETLEVRQVSGPNESLPQRVRDAMTRGVLWEQPEVANWQKWSYQPNYQCYGCHVQAQAATGLAVAKQKLPELPLDADLERAFVDAHAAWQQPETGWMPDNDNITEGSLWAWTVSRFRGANFDRLSYRFLQTLDWLLTRQSVDGSWSYAADNRANKIYIDADPTIASLANATHTAGNIQALAKALDATAGRDFVPMPPAEFDPQGGGLEFLRNPGRSLELGFAPAANVTAVRLSISDTFYGQGLFVLNELEAFQGAAALPISGAAANFSQVGYPIATTIDGVKDDQNNGWAYGPQDSRVTPAQGLWTFNGPVSLDRLRIAQVWPAAQLKKIKVEVTTDVNPTLDSHFVEVSGLQPGYATAERKGRYLGALTRAANALSGADWLYRRNVRTAAQTIIGLKAALPYLSGVDAAAAQSRIDAVEQFLRGTQRTDGGWEDAPSGGEPSGPLPSAEALEALLLVARSSTDPAIIAGAEYLLGAQKQDGSWDAPPDVQRRLASTTWVQIALPTIFENLSSITVNVDHRAAATTGSVPLAGSFSPVPSSQTTTGDTASLQWDGLINSDAGQSFSLLSELKGMQPGEVRQISRGTTVDYSSVAGNGTLELAPLFVSAQHILTLAPAVQSATAGDSTSFTVTLSNPFAHAQTFDLSVSGLPDGSYELPATLNLAAGEVKTFALGVHVPYTSLPGSEGFAVQATTADGVKDRVNAQIVISEAGGSAAEVALDTRAFDLRLTPAVVAAGQGTQALYTVRLSNVGATADSYNLVASLPAGFAASFSEQTVAVAPGLGSYRDVSLVVVPPPGTPAGDYPVLVSAVSTTDSTVTNTASGLLKVSDYGVALAFLPDQGSPNTSLLLRVSNTGRLGGVFDLSLGGAGALSAILGTTSVDLLPGAFWDVSVALGNYDWALPGRLSLFGHAVARNDGAVGATAGANVEIAPHKALDASLDPPTQVLPNPGSADFTLRVKNTGNVEDAYTASIVQVGGGAAATLIGQDGQPGQSVSLFRLPGLGDGSLSLRVRLEAPGLNGTVKVRIGSTTDATVQKDLLAQIATAAVNRAPAAQAGQNRNVYTNSAVALDGSASSDPDGDLLTDYRWRLLAVPAGSDLVDTSIADNHTPSPRIVPDVAGLYRLELIVSDGKLDSEPAYVEIAAAAANVPPNAQAGQDQTVAVGATAVLDGHGSLDPDAGPVALTYAWSLLSEPEAGHGVLQDETAPVAQFSTDLPGVYTVELHVFDGRDTATDTLNITVTPANVPPVADAGSDLALQLGDTAALNAGASHDPDQGPWPLSYAWSLVSVPTGSGLDNSAITPDANIAARAAFVPDVAGEYVLKVTVSDGATETSDNVVVKVAPALREQDVSDLVLIVSSDQKTTLDRKTRKMTSSVNLTLTNASIMDIKSPIRVVFELTGTGVSITGAKVDQTGHYYLDVSKTLLKPGESVVLNVQFTYASGTTIRYATQVFGTVAR
ncbi:discoidin domain-containing protein [Methylococcus sp. EFPC2]|uniref:PKD domain-containing protein n=1 Tax=Methylococcus sp. EFPC2 TaxID=2812648 RepID=UPI001967634D|nr:discoidin domain-containing protein [Methylococcus sp. EFPC2]QSA98735.1 discoidin domain-containing protein [Methylococcus sp. EFPC2]